MQSTWFPLIHLNPQTYVDTIFKGTEADFKTQIIGIFTGSIIEFSVVKEDNLIQVIFFFRIYDNQTAITLKKNIRYQLVSKPNLSTTSIPILALKIVAKAKAIE